MFEARTDGMTREAWEPVSPVERSGPARGKRPVLVILHQEHSNPGHIGQWFVRNGYRLDIRKPRFGDPLPATLGGHAGVVIFGGPQSANDTDAFITQEIGLAELALNERRPYLGVCLGGQMLARCLGAKVSLHPEKIVEIGYHRVAATRHGEAIGSWPEQFYQWHKEGFEVPCGARLLARGGDGAAFPNQAFCYGPAAVGIQFHPEITYWQVHRWTGHNAHRLTQPGAHPRGQQIAAHIDHAPRVHAWLDRFLSQWVAARLTVG